MKCSAKQSIVVNENSDRRPDQSVLLPTEGSALLNLLCVLNYDPDRFPVADLLAKSMRLTGEWVVLSPVFWQASHNDAIVVASGKSLQMNANELATCFNAYADFLSEEGFTLVYYDEDHWLLSASGRPPLHAKSVYSLLNQSFMPELSQIDNSFYWQKFITESQMFFASQPGHMALNGVWAWGGGHCPDAKPIRIFADAKWQPIAEQLSAQVISNEPDARLSDFEIILIDHLNTFTAMQSRELNALNINWYWNNMAYATNKSNWFNRLWRKCRHEH